MYVREGDGFVGTILTQGGWDPGSANGGTVLALIGHCLDEVPTLVPMTLSRLTADIHRPVPIGRVLHVRSSVVREGKKIQVVELSLVDGDLELVRVSALRVRDQAVPEDALRSTTDARPGDALLPPEQSMRLGEISPQMPGFLGAVDMRRSMSPDGRTAGTWFRLIAPVVAGSPVSRSANLAAMFDCSNLIGMTDHPSVVTMINPDVSAHVLRVPSGEWVAITGETRFNLAMGRGISTATFSDDDGVFAYASISQILQMR
ncbi:MAG: hypothetical protein JWN62_3772 [Acidimicrobiales bacterium]|nr:hypothetical protein [Acidimicrobiales bacterium]